MRENDVETMSVMERMRVFGKTRLLFGPKSVIGEMLKELGLSQYLDLYRLAAAFDLAGKGFESAIPSHGDEEKQEVRVDVIDRSDDDYIFYRLFCRLSDTNLDQEEYRKRLKESIERGLSYMYWELGIGRGQYSEKDYRLIDKVLSVSNDDSLPATEVQGTAKPITIDLGYIKDELKTVALNDRHLVPALNMAITGTSGSGKTYFALNIMFQILQNSSETRCVVIDPKGDIAEKYGKQLSKYGFQFYRLSLEDDNTLGGVQTSLPINPFMLGQSKNAITERLLAVFREAVFQNNPVQQSNFREAVSQLLERNESKDLTIADLAEEYIDQKEGKPDKVSNFLESLVNNRVFSPSGMNPREFFTKNVVVSYAPDLNNDIQGLVTNLLVTLFRDSHQHLSEGDPDNQYRRFNRLLFIDEAHNLSNMKSTGLKRLLREGRSFGLGLILASQHVNHFGQLIQGIDLREEIPMWFILKQTINSKTQQMIADMFQVSSEKEKSQLNRLTDTLNNSGDGEYLAITNLNSLHESGIPLRLESFD